MDKIFTDDNNLSYSFCNGLGPDLSRPPNGPQKNIMDNPNERSSHTVPTPRGGGLAFVITWFSDFAYKLYNNNKLKYIRYTI